jgi:hypothetical protein
VDCLNSTANRRLGTSCAPLDRYWSNGCSTQLSLSHPCGAGSQPERWERGRCGHVDRPLRPAPSFPSSRRHSRGATLGPGGWPRRHLGQMWTHSTFCRAQGALKIFRSARRIGSTRFYVVPLAPIGTPCSSNISRQRSTHSLQINTPLEPPTRLLTCSVGLLQKEHRMGRAVGSATVSVESGISLRPHQRANAGFERASASANP